MSVPARFQSALLPGIILVALNLRPVIAGLGPLLAQVQRELHVSSTTMSLLTTVPLVLFGVLAPLAPLLGRRAGSEGAILWSTLAIGVGALLRVGPTLPAIMLGTILAGAGIAVNNVLLPGLVKRFFPGRAGLMTGVYTTAVVFGATLASGLAVPLRDALGGQWRLSLGIWAGAALLGVAAWLPVRRAARQDPARPSFSPGRLWQDPLAWQVTVFMGLQSLVFYAWLTWLPKLFQDHGMPAAASGLLLSAGNLVQLPFTFLVPVLAARLPHQRGLAAATAGMIGAGLVGLLVSPAGLALLWVLLLGAGCGSAFSLALTLIVLRADEGAQVAALSGMAQGVGYLLAAGGPLAFGWLHDRTGSWQAPLWALLACTLLILLSGLGAGRPLQVLGGRAEPVSTDEAEWASIGAETGEAGETPGS